MTDIEYFHPNDSWKITEVHGISIKDASWERFGNGHVVFTNTIIQKTFKLCVGATLLLGEWNNDKQEWNLFELVNESHIVSLLPCQWSWGMFRCLWAGFVMGYEAAKEDA